MTRLEHTKVEGNKVYMNNGTILVSYNKRNPLYRWAYPKYVVTRYDWCNFTPEYARKYLGKELLRISNTDNLQTIDVSEDERKKLMNLFTIKPNDHVVELGAFEGFGTLRLSEWVGKNGHVYAIEPELKNFKLIKENIKINNRSNITAFNIGTWSTTGKLTLQHKAQQGSTLFIDKQAKNTTEINVYTLDQLMLEEKIKKIDLIIMETNNCEVETLLGMSNLLKQNKLRIALPTARLLYKNKKTYDYAKEILGDNGFTVHIGKMGKTFAYKGY